MRRIPALVGSWSLAWMVLACGSTGEDRGGIGVVCPPDALRICTCEDGGSGIQRCAGDGSGFSSCVCTGDLGDDTGLDPSSDLTPDAGDSQEWDQGTDAVGDVAPDTSQDPAGIDEGREEESVCVDPALDCSGALPDPTCTRGILTHWQWDCYRNQCVPAESAEICDFGCAPPDRGVTCARLVYTDQETDEICLVSSLDDDPSCTAGGGHNVAWHPSNPGLLAYTVQGDPVAVVILDIGSQPPQALCRLDPLEIGGTTLAYLNGSWIHGSERLIMLEGIEPGYYLLSQWSYGTYGQSCLAPREAMCAYLVAASDLSVANRFAAAYNRNRSHLYVLFGATSQEDQILQVRRIGSEADSSACGDLVFTTSGVTAAGWKGAGELLFVESGSLQVYSVGSNSAHRLVDATAAWSGGAYAIADFNYNATVLVAHHAAEDRFLLFRIPADGLAPEPWPAPGANALDLDAAHPSIERFQPGP